MLTAHCSPLTAYCSLPQFPRQPMHDVECELAVIDAGAVHAKLHLLRADHLRREHSGFTQNNHAAFTNTHRNALRASGPNAKRLSAGPFSDCPVKAITLFTRSLSSRPRVTG